MAIFKRSFGLSGDDYDDESSNILLTSQANRQAAKSLNTKDTKDEDSSIPIIPLPVKEPEVPLVIEAKSLLPSANKQYKPQENEYLPFDVEVPKNLSVVERARYIYTQQQNVLLLKQQREAEELKQRLALLREEKQKMHRKHVPEKDVLDQTARNMSKGVFLAQTTPSSQTQNVNEKRFALTQNLSSSSEETGNQKLEISAMSMQPIKMIVNEKTKETSTQSNVVSITKPKEMQSIPKRTFTISEAILDEIEGCETEKKSKLQQLFSLLEEKQRVLENEKNSHLQSEELEMKTKLELLEFLVQLQKREQKLLIQIKRTKADNQLISAKAQKVRDLRFSSLINTLKSIRRAKDSINNALDRTISDQTRNLPQEKHDEFEYVLEVVDTSNAREKMMKHNEKRMRLYPQPINVETKQSIETEKETEKITENETEEIETAIKNEIAKEIMKEHENSEVIKTEKEKAISLKTQTEHVIQKRNKKKGNKVHPNESDGIVVKTKLDDDPIIQQMIQRTQEKGKFNAEIEQFMVQFRYNYFVDCVIRIQQWFRGTKIAKTFKRYYNLRKRCALSFVKPYFNVLAQSIFAKRYYTKQLLQSCFSKWHTFTLLKIQKKKDRYFENKFLRTSVAKTTVRGYAKVYDRILLQSFGYFIILERRMILCFTQWKEMVMRKRKRNICLIRIVKNLCIYKIFEMWRRYSIYMSSKRAHITWGANISFISLPLWDEWIEIIKERKERKDNALRIGFRKRPFVKAFSSWLGFTLEEKDRKKKLLKYVQLREKRILLNSFLHWVSEKTKLKQLRLVIFEWHAFAQSMKRNRSIFGVLSLRRNRKLKQKSFQHWRTFIHSLLALRAVTVLKTLQNSSISLLVCYVLANGDSDTYNLNIIFIKIFLSWKRMTQNRMKWKRFVLLSQLKYEKRLLTQTFNSWIAKTRIRRTFEEQKMNEESDIPVLSKVLSDLEEFKPENNVPSRFTDNTINNKYTFPSLQYAIQTVFKQTPFVPYLGGEDDEDHDLSDDEFQNKVVQIDDNDELESEDTQVFTIPQLVQKKIVSSDSFIKNFTFDSIAPLYCPKDALWMLLSSIVQYGPSILTEQHRNYYSDVTKRKALKYVSEDEKAMRFNERTKQAWLVLNHYNVENFQELRDFIALREISRRMRAQTLNKLNNRVHSFLLRCEAEEKAKELNRRLQELSEQKNKRKLKKKNEKEIVDPAELERERLEKEQKEKERLKKAEEERLIRIQKQLETEAEEKQLLKESQRLKEEEAEQRRERQKQLNEEKRRTKQKMIEDEKRRKEQEQEQERKRLKALEKKKREQAEQKNKKEIEEISIPPTPPYPRCPPNTPDENFRSIDDLFAASKGKEIVRENIGFKRDFLRLNDSFPSELGVRFRLLCTITGAKFSDGILHPSIVFDEDENENENEHRIALPPFCHQLLSILSEEESVNRFDRELVSGKEASQHETVSNLFANLSLKTYAAKIDGEIAVYVSGPYIDELLIEHSIDGKRLASFHTKECGAYLIVIISANKEGTIAAMKPYVIEMPSKGEIDQNSLPKITNVSVVSHQPIGITRFAMMNDENSLHYADLLNDNISECTILRATIFGIPTDATCLLSIEMSSHRTNEARRRIPLIPAIVDLNVMSTEKFGPAQKRANWVVPLMSSQEIGFGTEKTLDRSYYDQREKTEMPPLVKTKVGLGSSFQLTIIPVRKQQTEEIETQKTKNLPAVMKTENRSEEVSNAPPKMQKKTSSGALSPQSIGKLAPEVVLLGHSVALNKYNRTPSQMKVESQKKNPHASFLGSVDSTSSIYSTTTINESERPSTKNSKIRQYYTQRPATGMNNPSDTTKRASSSLSRERSHSFSDTPTSDQPNKRRKQTASREKTPTTIMDVIHV